MSEQETFSFAHPRDAEIRAVYLSGKGIRETANALGLGRGAVERAVHRMGIVRTDAQEKTGHIDWDKAAALYRQGNGVKNIAKVTGGSAASIRAGLIRAGVYIHGQHLKSNATWGGYVAAEIAPMRRYEREHGAWWLEAYPREQPTPEQKKRAAMEKYYANHEESKRASAAYAKARHNRLKNEPWYKMKCFARNQLMRIARQGKGYAKTCRTMDHLGCTYEQAAQYIAAQFKPGWSWDNHGTAWEIDHIIQLSAGQLMDSEHKMRVCHYTNLRPLSVDENRSRPWGSWAGKQHLTA